MFILGETDDDYGVDVDTVIINMELEQRARISTNKSIYKKARNAEIEMIDKYSSLEMKFLKRQQEFYMAMKLLKNK